MVAALTVGATGPSDARPLAAKAAERTGHHAPTSPKRADTERVDSRATVHVATLNLKSSLSQSAVAHDIHQVISQGGPSVIGFQERGGSRAQMLAALPSSWTLVMPSNKSGTDLNPVAFDSRVWELRNSFPSLLTDHTWRRSRGNIAIDQYAVVANLRHRETGQTIRAVSFHMPPSIHSRSGGPNYGLRPRVEAFWRMAASVDRLAKATPDTAQFVAMCDCNVGVQRDSTNKLLEGKVIEPLDLVTNYDVRDTTKGMSIDYVMTPRDETFALVDAVKINGGLITDHPAIVSKLKESKSAYRDRTLVDVAGLLFARE
ncbi:hypothetical protein BH11ACT8_BH11ACT8_27390 [soil metagenome]